MRPERSSRRRVARPRRNPPGSARSQWAAGFQIPSRWKYGIAARCCEGAKWRAVCVMPLAVPSTAGVWYRGHCPMETEGLSPSAPDEREYRRSRDATDHAGIRLGRFRRARKLAAAGCCASTDEALQMPRDVGGCPLAEAWGRRAIAPRRLPFPLSPLRGSPRCRKRSSPSRLWRALATRPAVAVKQDQAAVGQRRLHTY